MNKKLNLFLLLSLIITITEKISFAEESNIESINNIIAQQQAVRNQTNDNDYQQQIINNQQTIIQEQQKLIENLKQSNNTNNSQQNNQQNQTLISQNTQQNNQIQDNNTQEQVKQNIKNGRHWEIHLAPIVYYNTLRNSLDIGGNFYFEYRQGMASFIFGVYGVYNGVYGNNWQNWSSPNDGETGKFSSLFSVVGDIGLKISGTNAYGSFVFGVGGGMTKFNVSNTNLGGGYKGTKGIAKLHLGFEFGYKRFFTRFDVLFGLGEVSYIDDYGISRVYSKHTSTCRSNGNRGGYYSCNKTTSQVDLLLGVGFYLF